jgi:asparagine synthase (glutamine-hydrolysing)
MLHHVERVVDLLDPGVNAIHNMSVEEARRRVLSGEPASIRGIDGSFALVARDGITVRLARSLDRPMRYFLAKRQEGPALFVADRIDTLKRALADEGLAAQFHPSYTRMVPAHYVLELRLVGCPDPDPTYTRFFEPVRAVLPPDVDEIGRRYIGALANEVGKWLTRIEQRGRGEPIGVAFSGGIDSGAVFLVTYHTMLRLGLSPARLKAFTLNLGGGQDLEQARTFLDRLGLSMFLEEVAADAANVDIGETLGTLEDYKPLDVQCAAMGLLLSRGIRERYPGWRYVIDGDGGDENLKDYPIEDNSELTIRSVVNNRMLYQEGWGVDSIKHSLTYSGGFSRGCVRGYACASTFGFVDFSPYLRPPVIAVAEAIPFAELTQGSHERLYALKGEVVARGVRSVLGVEMPIFPKRRFQNGSVADGEADRLFPRDEARYRRHFQTLHAAIA